MYSIGLPRTIFYRITTRDTMDRVNPTQPAMDGLGLPTQPRPHPSTHPRDETTDREGTNGVFTKPPLHRPTPTGDHQSDGIEPDRKIPDRKLHESGLDDLYAIDPGPYLVYFVRTNLTNKLTKESRG